MGGKEWESLGESLGEERRRDGKNEDELGHDEALFMNSFDALKANNAESSEEGEEEEMEEAQAQHDYNSQANTSNKKQGKGKGKRKGKGKGKGKAKSKAKGKAKSIQPQTETVEDIPLANYKLLDDEDEYSDLRIAVWSLFGETFNSRMNTQEVWAKTTIGERNSNSR